MNPLFFGSAARRLFGVYHPAAGGGPGRGVVICPPWGREQIRSHRARRLLAERLAQAGCDTLRFDYYGTGDSAGDAHEVTLDGWAEDIRAAVREVRDLAGVHRVTLVGLRLGAAAAASACDERPVDRLVAWDPVVDGRGYAAELLGPGSGDEREGADDRGFAGFPLPPTFLSGIERVGPDWFSDVPEEVMIVVSEERDEHLRLRDHLSGHGRSVTYEHIPAPASWTEDEHLGVGATPTELLERITTWGP